VAIDARKKEKTCSAGVGVLEWPWTNQVMLELRTKAVAGKSELVASWEIWLRYQATGYRRILRVEWIAEGSADGRHIK
jgi:hypothetical protein